MNFYGKHFDDYIHDINLHPEIKDYIDRIPNNVKEFKNLIIYGGSGVGKYTQMINIVKKYSLSELKYEKKISINCNKILYYFKISDIHYEIDMSLLGCQSKILWNEIFLQILEVRV